MKRGLFNAAALLSLLLCAAIGGLWALTDIAAIGWRRANYFPPTRTQRSDWITLEAGRAIWLAKAFNTDVGARNRSAWTRYDSLDPLPLSTRPYRVPGRGFYGFGMCWHSGPVFTTVTMSTNWERRIELPFYLLMIPLLWPVLGYLWRLRATTHPAGICPTCGYDLRATPDRCPECGALPAVTPS